MMFFWLLVGHAVCDYPLQGDFLAQGKNHRSPIPGIPWQWCLFWHALMHGGAVALVTGAWQLGVLETVIHIGIDAAKSEGLIGFNVDQSAHIVCKGAWVGLMAM